MPAKAKLPVIAWNCQAPAMNTSRAIASISQGSRPSTIGRIAATAVAIPAASAARVHSPQPIRPLSAISLTTTSVTPSRATSELTSAWV